MNKSERTDIAQSITLKGFYLNLLLTVLKFIGGIFGRSAAMLADAVHSFSDIATDLVVIFGIRASNKPFDENHPYGHGKFETLSTTLLGLLLFAVAVGILWSAIGNVNAIVHGEEIGTPGYLALIAAVISILSKEFLYHLTIRVGNKINSQSIIANAWHHRTDALSSVGTFCGIGGAMFLGEDGRILDPIAAIFVSFFIFKVAYQVLHESVNELLESAASEECRQRIIEICKDVPGALNPHNLRTRKIGSNLAADLHIKVDKNLSIVEAHDISTHVERAIKDEFGDETFISVHIEPLD